MAQHRYLLPEDRIPDHSCDIAADPPSVPPPRYRALGLEQARATEAQATLSGTA